MMPGMDGFALCRAIKSDPETDFIPVILLTARAEPADRLAGLREQADDYLTKPFEVPEQRNL
jgi:CheY-like chemotaxis protein